MPDNADTAAHNLDGVRCERDPKSGPIWISKCSCGHESSPQPIEDTALEAWVWHFEQVQHNDGGEA